MNIFHKIKMPLTHRLSLLYIILISGFKLGMAAPADSKKGKKWKKVKRGEFDMGVSYSFISS